MKSRVVILFLTFAAAFIAVVARLFYLQCLPNSNLDRLKKAQYMTVVSLPSQRGKILDRKGAELATTVASLSLYADPSVISKPKKLSKRLAAALEIDAKQIYGLLTSDRKFVWLKRRLDPDVAAEIKDWDEEGLHFVEEGRRAYPNQNLFSQVLGFVGTEGEGLEGLEKKYDGELKGEQQNILSRRDARGRPLVVSGQIFELHADGATLETTIDKDLQYELERELENVTLNQQANTATGIIMDPATGEILAMASYPSFDPARGTHAPPELRRNRGVGDIFEPGSTFKVVTVAAALRTGRIQPNSKYFCENGKFKIGKHTIHEAETVHTFGWLSLADILAVSSNIGITKVAFEVGQKSLLDMLTAFGFIAKTGVDISGEGAGLLADRPWPEHLFSNISFGQGIGVTALQMANAYSAIANGGRLMKPYLVKRIVDSDHKIVLQREPEAVRRVLTQKEASTLTLMLSGVTETGGTGVMARVDGYPVAGKTGTAQKVNPNGRGYLPKAYLSSFAGFVPANNPQFTIYIVVDSPKKQHHGADVAAPIFNHIASFALHQRGFMPIVVAPALSAAPQKQQLPLQTAVKFDLNRILDVEKVPELKGLTVREVGRILGEYDKRVGLGPVELIGSGTAESQSPTAGSKVVKGQKIRVIFHPSG